MTLAEIRKKWERVNSQTNLLVFQEFGFEDMGSITLILRNPDQNNFQINRYFKLGEDWKVSVDLQSGSMADVIKYLCQEINTQIMTIRSH